MRKLAVIAGLALVVIAFAAATRVADTREGLVAEVVTLLASLGGVGLLIYGLTARPGMPGTNETAARPDQPRPRTRSDLVYGAAGVGIAAVLVTGLALSGGLMLAVFGLALLLPMIAGCVYLCVRYMRASP
ncbi:MAG TPA: hypothetical protein VFK22_08030 [Candidatus Dormibacteraeota bacterium]|nr:hypothetical protein [Candidatus Dormibacteraeota bacterium]